MNHAVTAITFIALDKLKREHPEYAAGVTLHAVDPSWSLHGEMAGYLRAIGILQEGDRMHELVREAVLRYEWGNEDCR